MNEEKEVFDEWLFSWIDEIFEKELKDVIVGWNIFYLNARDQIRGEKDKLYHLKILKSNLFNVLKNEYNNVDPLMNDYFEKTKELEKEKIIKKLVDQTQGSVLVRRLFLFRLLEHDSAKSIELGNKQRNNERKKEMDSVEKLLNWSFCLSDVWFEETLKRFFLLQKEDLIFGEAELNQILNDLQRGQIFDNKIDKWKLANDATILKKQWILSEKGSISGRLLEELEQLLYQAISIYLLREKPYQSSFIIPRLDKEKNMIRKNINKEKNEQILSLVNELINEMGSPLFCNNIKDTRLVKIPWGNLSVQDFAPKWINVSVEGFIDFYLSALVFNSKTPQKRSEWIDSLNSLIMDDSIVYMDEMKNTFRENNSKYYKKFPQLEVKKQLLLDFLLRPNPNNDGVDYKKIYLEECLLPQSLQYSLSNNNKTSTDLSMDLYPKLPFRRFQLKNYLWNTIEYHRNGNLFWQKSYLSRKIHPSFNSKQQQDPSDMFLGYDFTTVPSQIFSLPVFSQLVDIQTTDINKFQVDSILSEKDWNIKQFLNFYSKAFRIVPNTSDVIDSIQLRLECQITEQTSKSALLSHSSSDRSIKETELLNNSIKQDNSKKMMNHDDELKKLCLFYPKKMEQSSKEIKVYSESMENIVKLLQDGFSNYLKNLIDIEKKGGDKFFRPEDHGFTFEEISQLLIIDSFEPENNLIQPTSFSSLTNQFFQISNTNKNARLQTFLQIIERMFSFSSPTNSIPTTRTNFYLPKLIFELSLFSTSFFNNDPLSEKFFEVFFKELNDGWKKYQKNGLCASFLPVMMFYFGSSPFDFVGSFGFKKSFLTIGGSLPNTFFIQHLNHLSFTLKFFGSFSSELSIHQQIKEALKTKLSRVPKQHDLQAQYFALLNQVYENFYRFLTNTQNKATILNIFQKKFQDLSAKDGKIFMFTLLKNPLRPPLVSLVDYSLYSYLYILENRETTDQVRSFSEFTSFVKEYFKNYLLYGDVILEVQLSDFIDQMISSMIELLKYTPSALGSSGGSLNQLKMDLKKIFLSAKSISPSNSSKSISLLNSSKPIQNSSQKQITECDLNMF